MKVDLLTSHGTLKAMERNACIAALTCHGNAEKDNYTPEKTLRNIIKLGHESVLEHITLTYRVQDITRALLQELARHRHISLSVESTRHTLQKLLNSEEFITNLASELPHYQSIACKQFFDFIRTLPETTNDELKYFIPEFFPTRLILTTNIRELRHILKLRTHPAALMEFRQLGVKLFEVVPDELKYLLEDCVYVK